MKSIENKIYVSVIGLCEKRESTGAYRGNGHHLAQEICVKVTEGLLPKQQKSIYDVMDKMPKTSKQIGIKININSRIVSAQLKQIHQNTTLISFKNKGRIKYWYRNY